MAKPFSKVKSKLGLEDMFLFGKYTDSFVDDVAETDPEYIAWLVVNTSVIFEDSVLRVVLENILKKLDKKHNYKPAKVYSSIGLYRDESHNIHSDQDDWSDDIPF